MPAKLLLDQHPKSAIASTFTRTASRGDIDGLRAIAAISVVAFHAGVPGFTGGFIGVDIFFVISGFLIATSVTRRQEAGRFTALDFFERRARRLAGAFLFVVALTWLAAWLIFMPPDYEAFLSSVRGSVTLLANHHFYDSLGYFDTGHLTKPLLHVWSLAIEEQFYLAAAALFFISALKKQLFPAVLCLAVASLVASAIAVSAQPDAAFYLLPYRAWELLTGVALALWPERRKLSESYSTVFNGAGAIALLSLLAVIALYDPAIPFPGLAALPPVVLTALLIIAGETRKSITFNLLALRPMAMIGRRSYGIYLIHWPLIVFLVYYLDRALRAAEIVGVLIATMALAELSWHFIEKPLERRTARFFRAETLAASLVVLACFFVATRLPTFLDPLVSAVSPGAVELAGGRSDWVGAQVDCADRLADKIAAGETCRLGVLGGPRVLLWGDSHASAVLPALEAIAAQLKLDLRVITHNGCPPLPSITTEKSTCQAVNDAVLKAVSEGQFQIVVLAANWQSYGASNPITIEGMPLPANAPQLTYSVTRAIAAIRTAGAIPVIIGQVPVFERDVPTALAKQMYFANIDRLLGLDRQMSPPAIEAAYLKLATEQAPAIYLQPSDALCPSGRCEVADGSRSLYTDRSHLSRLGSGRLAKRLQSALQQALTELE